MQVMLNSVQGYRTQMTWTSRTELVTIQMWSGILMHWDKQYEIPGVETYDEAVTHAKETIDMFGEDWVRALKQKEADHAKEGSGHVPARSATTDQG